MCGLYGMAMPHFYTRVKSGKNITLQFTSSGDGVGSDTFSIAQAFEPTEKYHNAHWTGIEIYRSTARDKGYKKIATIDTLDDFYELQGEFIDRFGDIPPSVTNLLDISLIKVMCRQCEISAVTQKETSVNFSLTNRANPQAVVALIGEYERNMRFVGGDNPKIVYRFSGDVIGNIKIILQKLIKSIQELG